MMVVFFYQSRQIFNDFRFPENKSEIIAFSAIDRVKNEGKRAANNVRSTLCPVDGRLVALRSVSTVALSSTQTPGLYHGPRAAKFPSLAFSQAIAVGSNATGIGIALIGTALGSRRKMARIWATRIRRTSRLSSGWAS